MSGAASARAVAGLKETAADGPLLVPVVPDSRVRQQFSAPSRRAHPRIHVEPDCVHTKRRIGVRLEQTLLHPPGACDAGGSGR